MVVVSVDPGMRARLARWSDVLMIDGPRLEREYGVPLGWMEDLAIDLSALLEELRAMETVGARCVICGVPLVQPSTGRRRKYCSRAHRDRAARVA